MRKLLTLLTFLLVISSCSKKFPFQGNEYQLVQNNPLLTVSLSFAPKGNIFFGKVYNTYSGTFNGEGNKLGLKITEQSSGEGHYDVMAVEKDYFIQLQKVVSYKFGKNSLTLFTSDNYSLTFEKIGPAHQKS